MSVEAKLKALGLELPPAPPPAANYKRCVRVGKLAFFSGQLDNFEYPNEAIQFTLFSTGPLAQAEEAKNPTAIPSIKEVAESTAFIDPSQPPEHMDQFIKELDYGRPAADIYHPTKFQETSQVMGEELDFLWRGKQDAAETCSVIKQRLDELLAEA